MSALTRRRRAVAVAALGISALAFTACSSGGSGGNSASGGGTLHVTLITKDPNDPFWVAMINGAKTEAKKQSADITVASGKDQTDADSQIRAIEDATTRGDDGIMIANNGPAVNDAIKKAEKAGLFVVALDTPTTPVKLVPATFASDNRQAGELIGKWTAGTLAGKPATIALLDLFGDKIVGIDYERDQGFLAGMGVPLNDPNKNGDEAPTGNYSGGQYTIVCNETTNGAEDGGRTAMEKCLSKNPSINVVYTPNEPAALGAVQALKAAGNTGALVVSINGSCEGVSALQSGQFGAVAQQYPSKMGQMGVDAIVQHKKNGAVPTPSAGLDFTNTGIKLVTDKPVSGLDSITSSDGKQLCY
jgi:fructose transport system substrate-binding protein